MREELVTKVAVVQESTAEAFQEALNKILRTTEDPQIQFNMAMGHCAYITYKEVEKQVESAEDEYISKAGERCHCGDCPYIEMSKDKRVKYHTCRYSEYPIRVTTNACELYYKRLLKGEL